MKTQSVRAGLILTSIFFEALSGLAQVNSWTSPSSGSWHDPSWSLGVLPDASQSHILITNSGWKAVAINRTTALNYPDSLNIRHLIVSSPVDSFNTLMLNFSGREWPLRVAEAFHLRTNSVFMALDSALHVGNIFAVDGTVIHTDFSEVSASSILIGNTTFPPLSDFDPYRYAADYNLTNGTLTVRERLFIGVSSFGILRQYGGSNHVQELRLGFGDYHLRGGTLTANTFRMGSPRSLFIQLAGHVSVTNPVIIGESDGLFAPYFETNIQGNYVMRGGTFRASALRLGTPNGPSNPGAQGSFNQEGGTNITTALHVGAGGMGNTLRCRYDLWAGGVLQTASTTIGPGFDASFFHADALHLIDGPLLMRGVRDPSAPFITRPFYSLGGLLRCRSMTIAGGEFHNDGTNDVAGDLLLGESNDVYTTYTLHDGLLTASNTLARLGRFTNDCFFHKGGVHIVARRLDLAGPPDGVIYELNDGLLIAPDIRITNGVFLHYRGGSISNLGTITLAGAEWRETIAGNTSLGALRVETAPRDSMISLTHTLGTIRFLPSAALAWASGAELVIRYWSGSTNGGGNHQLIFGNSASGLTAQQLSQIRFRDPAGFPSGDYPARILSTGEIVPVGSAQPPVTVNSWIKPASGNWEESSSWSLGVPPHSSHSQIMITNAGWKAVAIGRATALNHPSSLDVQRLTISSPVDSRNTLLLNFSGREWPLRIATAFELGFDSTLIVLDSGLRVGGAMVIDGSVIHSDFSEVTTPFLYIGNHHDTSGAEYNLTNGTLIVSNRLFLGPHAFGTFRQHGGSNHVSELRLGFGLYHLPAGHLAAGTLKLGSFYSLFDQFGGDVSVTNALVLGENDGSFNWHQNIWGRYTLSNGTLRTPLVRIGTPNEALDRGGGEGTFTQYGGSNFTTRLHVGAGGASNSFRANYTLINGFLNTSATTVGPGYDVAVSQSGGLHLVDGPLIIEGAFHSNFRAVGTHYGLAGGTLRSRSLTVSESLFFHVNGTNDVAGDLLLTPPARFGLKAEYSLVNGHLITSNTLVRSEQPWGFRHNGGTHQVNRLLELSGRAGYGDGFLIYEFNGGHLAAPDIRISEGIFGHVGGTVSNAGTITLAGGEWQDLTVGLTRLGVLRLEAATKESSIALFGVSTTLRFLPSGGAAWGPNTRLVIRAWSGSTNGAGNHQVIFGNNNSGLTAQQLRQILFLNPAGLSSGEYPARILSTGEIVPEPLPALAVVRNGSGRRLEWPAGYTLQTATNISGPFTDINAASPYDIQTGPERQRYFRLRRTP